MRLRDRTEELGGAGGVALALALLVGWTLRGLDAGALLGREGTDALRALWGLEILGRSALPPNLPFWTRELNPPAGAVGLLLPWVSGLLAAPLVWALDPVSAYDLFVAGLLWAAGVAAAALGRVVSGSWAAGGVVGAALLAQPMLLWALADGTVEHAAIWGLPAFLAAGLLLARRPTPRRALAAGLLLAVVALDSPYHAVYAALLGLVVLPPELGRGAGADGATRARALAIFAACAVGVAALLVILRLALPVGSGGGLDAAALQAVNTTSLESWARAERGLLPPEGPAPTLIPGALLLGAAALALLAPRRSGPWALVGALALLLSFGLDPRLPAQAEARWGAAGGALGEAALALNGLLYRLPGLDLLRFPSRWLVPAALAWAVAGSLGLARLLGGLGRAPLARAGAALALGALCFSLAWRAGPFARGLPTQRLPEVEFTRWIAQQPEAGTVALLPVLRAAPPGEGRNDRPVFAGLDPAMAGLDAATLQVLHGRPQLGAPGLQTLLPLALPGVVARTLQDWDDLTHPRLTGNPIPPSARDPRADRARGEGVDLLVERGLRWVAIDLGAYDAEGLAELRRQLQPWVESERRFEEGDGVLVLVIGRRSENS